MTVIAALHQNGETWIGSDSRITENGRQFRGHSKLIEGHSIMLAWTGAYRTFGLLQANIDKVVGSPWGMANIIRGLLKEDGYSTTGTGAPDYGGSMIIATPAGVYDLTGDFSVYEAADGEIITGGSGGKYAAGAGFIAAERHPSERIRSALNAACHFDVDCGAPLHLHRVIGAVAALKAAQ